MSEDLTKKTPDPDGDLFTLILTIVRKLDKHETILTQIVDRLNKHETILTQILDRLGKLESRLDALQIRLYAMEARFESFEQTIKRSVHNLLEPQHRKPTNSST